MRVESNSNQTVQPVTKTADAKPKTWADKPAGEKDTPIARIYINASKTEDKDGNPILDKNNRPKKSVEYLKIYLNNGTDKPDTLSAFKTKPGANPDTAHWEYKNKETNVVTVKVNKVFKGEKETLKVELFDDSGDFLKSFVAYKTLEKTSDKTPDYTAFSKTLTVAKK